MLHVGLKGEGVCPVLEVKKRNFRHPSVEKGQQKERYRNTSVSSTNFLLLLQSEPEVMRKTRSTETSLKNNLKSLKKHLTNEEAARRKEGKGWGSGFILRKPGGTWSVSPAAYGSVDSWVKQNKPNHNPRTQDAEPTWDTRRLQRLSCERINPRGSESTAKHT